MIYSKGHHVNPKPSYILHTLMGNVQADYDREESDIVCLKNINLKHHLSQKITK